MKKFITITMVAMMLLMSACSGKTGGEGASKVDIPEAQTTSAQETTENKESEETNETKAAESEDKSESTEKETKEEKTTEKSDEKEKQTEKKTTFSSGTKGKSESVVLNGKTIRIGMTATDKLMSSIGQTLDVQNAPSCHYDGNDTIYVYDGFSVYTYADAGTDKIYLVEISGSNVSTAEGAKVGMTLEQIEKMYGKSTSSSASRITYSISSNVELSFTIAGNTVVLIEYVEK